MIIYIVGYGRSGSTALSEVLEQKLNACNLGEVKYLYRNGKDDLLDEYWLLFKEEHKDILSDESSRLKQFDNCFGLLRWGDRTWYKRRWQDIFKAAGLNEEDDIIIDSSKTTLDAFMRGIYLYYCFDEVYFVQPERKITHIIKSLLKGKNSNIERGTQRGKGKRFLHAFFVGFPHLIITKLLTQVYRFFGLEIINVEYMDKEVDEFIKNKGLKKSNRSVLLPVIYGNRNRNK